MIPSEEYGLIQRLREILPPVGDDSPYVAAIGDDAAVRVCKTAGERLIVTADVSVEGVHFSLGAMTFEEIGYRAMASNLSDCAAMGARPDGAVAQLVFPKGEGISESIEQIYAGFAKACGRWAFPVVGGDLSAGGAWVIGITLFGSAPPGGRLLMRTGIAAGDALWVTGPPGESAAGLAAIAEWGRAQAELRCKRLVDAHVTPTPAVAEGMALAAAPAVHAMMDLSDGLSKDVATLCFDNQLGFIFDKDAENKASPETVNLAEELCVDYREWFYHGGEEYELLFAADPSFDPSRINGILDGKPNLTRLGRFTSTTRKILTDGGSGELPMKSWDHLTETCQSPPE